MLRVIYKTFMLSVFMLNVVMLSAIRLRIVAPFIDFNVIDGGGRVIREFPKF
jgi:hypothetical protein